MNRNARISSGILADIVEVKRAEVAALRRHAGAIRERAESRMPPPDFREALAERDSIGIVAEVKRRSPSAGAIRADAPAAVIAGEYAAAGAASVSVLTDERFFGGTLRDLEEAADRVDLPLLRKDFTIDSLQILEARAAGAAAVLLIARILDDAELADFGALAGELRMSALVEVHDEEEVERALNAGAHIIGVNNRDLTTFTTDLAVTERLARYVPGEVILIGESGVQTLTDIERLARSGADAVLVGEALMRGDDAARMIDGAGGIERRGR